MTDDRPESDEMTEKALQRELQETRSRLRALESELVETNEGMVALTIELENAKERYQTIFEESTDAILLIDPEQDTIFEVNSQACELLGYERDRFVTLSPVDIFPDERDRFHTFAEAVVHGWADGFTCRTKNGRKIDVDISASIVTLNGRSLLLASLHDVTERIRREQRLQVLTRIFRHNLRNDGNVIQGHADLLYNEVADPNLETSALAIRETIDDVLRLSNKVRRIQDILDRNRVSWRPLSDLLATNREWFEEAHPAATLIISAPEREASVGGRLGMAVREVLENAAKHTGEEPLISISVEVDDDRDQVLIDIEDNGPGIPDHEFQVLHTGGETPLTHGSGIGLWFIHWVVNSLGGEMAVRHGEPNGTTISMIVPLETTQHAPELWR